MSSRTKRKLPPAHKRTALLLAGTGVLLHSPLLLADDAAEPILLEQIVVTGEKAGQDLQRTYSGVSVINSQQIEDLQIRDVRSTFQLLPNVNSSPSNRGNNGITIRGINSEGVGEPGQNARPMSSLVIDGATQSFEGVRRGARGLWDVQQVEVHRGPQATLQGRNAIAGAVVVKTNDPTFYWEGAARTSFAHLGQRSEAVMLSGPILNETLAFRITHESIEDSHGIRYPDRRLAGLGSGTYHNTRFKLLFTPSVVPGLSVKYTYSDAYDDPAVPAVRSPYFERVAADVITANLERRRNQVRNQILDLEYAFAKGWKFNAVSSSVDTRNLIGAATPVQDIQRDETRVDGDFTQDFRLSWEGERASVFGGLFYGRFRNSQDSRVTAFGLFGVQDLLRNTRINVLAAYTEARFKATDKLTFIVGGRQELEKTWIQTDYRSVTLTHGADGLVVAPRQRAKPFLPKLGLAYEFVPDQTLALTVSEGFRSGFTDIDGSPVKAESLMHYELAWRGKWLDGKLITNANVFRYDWRDQQVSLFDTATQITRTFNADKSELKGAELQIAVRPVPAAQVGVTVGLLSTTFKDFFVPATGTDYSGKQFPEAPRRTASLFGSWRHNNGIFISADATYKSGFYATSNLFNDESLKVPGYALVNLRAGYETEKWSAVLFCNNLFDRNYLLGRDRQGSVYVGDPRIVGMTLSARF